MSRSTLGDLSDGGGRHWRTRGPTAGGGAGITQPRPGHLLHRYGPMSGSAARARRELSARTNRDRRVEAGGHAADAGDARAIAGEHDPFDAPAEIARDKRRVQH